MPRQLRIQYGEQFITLMSRRDRREDVFTMIWIEKILKVSLFVILDRTAAHGVKGNAVFEGKHSIFVDL